MVTQRTPKAAKPKRAPQRKRAPKRELSLSERIIAIGKKIPLEELEKLPKDGAENLDHYIYGSPKRY